MKLARTYYKERTANIRVQKRTEISAGMFNSRFVQSYVTAHTQAARRALGDGYISG
jgi:hypothetical protein